MRKSFFTLLSSMLALSASAQLVNNGATITVQAGATLFVETNVSNSATGTINIEGNGILEIQGNLTNAVGGNLNTSPTSTVKFSGALASTLDAGNDSIANLQLAKTAAVNVSLMTNDLVIKNDLNFNGLGKLDANGRTLTYMGPATTTGFSATEYIVTGPDAAAGTGTVKKNYATGALAASAFTFHVGDAVSYSPLASSVTGTAAAAASVSARANDVVQPNRATVLPTSTNYLSRYWDVDAANISPYSNALAGTYINTTEDVASGMTAASIVGSSYSTAAPTSWSFASAAGVPPTVSGTTTQAASDFTGTDLFTKVNITANLQAPTIAGGAMSTDLQNYFGGNTGLLPTTSPYGAPTATYAGINNPAGAVGGVTDWVKVQIRSAANPATVLDTRSLLLKPNGTIVDTENSGPLVKGVGSVHLVVSHRNHQPVMSNPVTLNGTDVNYNFTTGLAQAFVSSGDPAQLVLKNTKWCIPTGDVNSDLSVDATDISIVKTDATAGIFELYDASDLNLDGSVDATDLALVKFAATIGYYSSLINF